LTRPPPSVLVAGAGRGIGAGTAVAFARAGSERVVLLGRTTAELERVAQGVEAAGAAALVLTCDVTSAEDRARAVEDAGALDAVVYCAGTNSPGPFVEVSEDTYDRIFEVNVRAGFFLAQEVIRGMLERGMPGTVVFVSSQMGHVGAAQRTVYCASKHAVEGLVKSLAVELASAGIRVVSIAPTFVRTALTVAQLDDPETADALLAQIPAGRVATVEEVADAVVWAASSGAAMVTGSSILVDGGWTAR
jgi:NAD(P)-dependent dehydrogenase (short-subunit alcohol dehydrogenase family)